jgi:hypothetical protein
MRQAIEELPKEVTDEKVFSDAQCHAEKKATFKSTTSSGIAKRSIKLF